VRVKCNLQRRFYLSASEGEEEGGVALAAVLIRPYRRGVPGNLDPPLPPFLRCTFLRERDNDPTRRVSASAPRPRRCTSAHAPSLYF
jgi:hypothetical protein